MQPLLFGSYRDAAVAPIQLRVIATPVTDPYRHASRIREKTIATP